MKKILLLLLVGLLIPVSIFASNPWRFDGQKVSDVLDGKNVYLYNIGAEGFAYPSLTYGANGAISEAATWMKLYKTWTHPSDAHTYGSGSNTINYPGGGTVTAADGCYFLQTSSYNDQLEIWVPYGNNQHYQTPKHYLGQFMGIGTRDDLANRNFSNGHVYFDRYAGEYMYPTNWQFIPVSKEKSGKENAYLLANIINGKPYYVYIAERTITARAARASGTQEAKEQYMAITDNLDNENANYYWLLLVKENREEDIYDVTRTTKYDASGNAVVEGGSDASFYLANHGFNRSNYNISSWKYIDQKLENNGRAAKTVVYGNTVTNNLDADNYGYYHIGVEGEKDANNVDINDQISNYGKYFCGKLGGTGKQEFYQDLNIGENINPKNVRVGFYRVYVEGFYNANKGRKAWLFAEVPAITRDNKLMYESDGKTLKKRRVYAALDALTTEEQQAILNYQKSNVVFQAPTAFNQTVAGRAIYEDDLLNQNIEDVSNDYRTNLFVYVPEVQSPDQVGGAAFRGPLRIGITTVNPTETSTVNSGNNEVYFDNFIVRYYGPSEVYMSEDAYRNLANKDDKYQQDGYRFFDDDPTEGDETHKGKWDKWDVVGYELHQVGNQKPLYADADGEPTLTPTDRRYSVSQVEFNDAKLILQRELKEDAWNTIVLPLNLTYANFKEAFGENSELAGLTSLAAGGERIHFSSKKPAGDNDVFMCANVPYLIYVESGEGHTVKTGPYQVWYPQGAIDLNMKESDAKKKYYIISNATSITDNEPGKAVDDHSTVVIDNSGTTAANPILAEATWGSEGDANYNKVSITGTYYARQYRGSDANDAVKATEGHPIYAFDGGILKSYKTGINIKGFRWWITESKEIPTTSEAKKMIIIDGVEDDATDIVINEMDADRFHNATIYDVTGKKVKANANSLDNLPRGIYIINGKKYVK